MESRSLITTVCSLTTISTSLLVEGTWPGRPGPLPSHGLWSQLLSWCCLANPLTPYQTLFSLCSSNQLPYSFQTSHHLLRQPKLFFFSIYWLHMHAQKSLESQISATLRFSLPLDLPDTLVNVTWKPFFRSAKNHHFPSPVNSILPTPTFSLLFF